MLISVKSLRDVWGVKPTGVLHVGAHEAEELDAYLKNNWMPITWIEAQPTKVEFLLKKLPKESNYLVNAAIWGTSNEKLTLKITNNTESTSLLELETHTLRHPEVVVESTHEVTTTTLDDLTLPTEVDYLSLDIQGSELQALIGFQKGIKNIKWVYTEVNKEALYRGCAIVEEVDSYLAKEGFQRELTVWTKYGWGDALYVRKGELATMRRFFGKFWIRSFYLRNSYYGLKHFTKMKLLKFPPKSS
jgi:FkbM family methyltransferase